jgi:hypothetical protein
LVKAENKLPVVSAILNEPAPPLKKSEAVSILSANSSSKISVLRFLSSISFTLNPFLKSTITSS